MTPGIATRIANFIGLTWGPPVGSPVGTRWAPYWPHEPFYQGKYCWYREHTNHDNIQPVFPQGHSRQHLLIYCSHMCSTNFWIHKNTGLYLATTDKLYVILASILKQKIIFLNSYLNVLITTAYFAEYQFCLQYLPKSIMDLCLLLFSACYSCNSYGIHHTVIGSDTTLEAVALEKAAGIANKHADERLRKYVIYPLYDISLDLI